MKNKTVDKSSGGKLPGYPHYPARDDMMNTTGEERVDIDPDELSKQTGAIQPAENNASYKSSDNTPDIIPGTEADVTEEDLQMLGSTDRSNDGGDDQEVLPKIEIGPDVSGDDLDVPGSELDDEMEAKGSEDEENNYYSRGQE